MGVTLKALHDQKLALDASSIVAETDHKGTITSVNDKFCDISGYSREELIGANHRILNSGHHPKSLWVEMYKTVSQDKPWHGEVCNRAKDGSLYWVDTTVLGFRNEAGDINRYVAIRHDITQIKRAQKLIREKMEQNLNERITINLLLECSVRAKNEEDLLARALGWMLCLDSLEVENKGAIFLVEGDAAELVLKVEKNLAALSEEIPHGVLEEKKFQISNIKSQISNGSTRSPP